MLLTLLVFFSILSVLVLVHEFGHFYFAKRAGVRVEEFGFGLPPKIFGKKKGETEYTINFLPFGGFVRLSGEELDKDVDMARALTDPKNFLSKSIAARMSIIVAGVFMNLVLAIVFYHIFFASTGYKTFSLPNFFDHNFRFGEVTNVNTVVLGHISEEASQNFESIPGEAILEVDNTPVYSVTDIRSITKDRVGEEVNVLLVDLRSAENELRTVTAIPVKDDNGDGILGVYLGRSSTIDYSGSKLLSGLLHTYNMLSYSISTMGKLIGETFSTKSVQPLSSSVSGPVGIASVVGTILDEKAKIQDLGPRIKSTVLSMLDLTALLSISLAFLNLLPIPALDGGRLLFVVMELITRRKVPIKFELMLHKAGMLLLLTLLVLVTVRDLGRLFL